ncbi:MAG TPA: hypothetical protein VFY24_04995 [Azospira sp.]|nr:hypothetical protein [Azospira sp.]
MLRRLAVLCALGAAVALSGCAAIPEQTFISEQPVATDALPGIITIALLEVPDPPHYYLGEGIGPATFFLGSLGAVLELSTIGRDSQAYRDFSFASVTQQRLVEHLGRRGYQVTLRPLARNPAHRLVDDYRALDLAGVDAVLDVVPVMAGFKRNPWSGPFASEVGPHVSMVVRLVAADASRRVLYAESAQYGYDRNPLASGIKIEAPASHKFKDADAVKANLRQAFAQLSAGIDAIARAIAAKLATRHAPPD